MAGEMRWQYGPSAKGSVKLAAQGIRQSTIS